MQNTRKTGYRILLILLIGILLSVAVQGAAAMLLRHSADIIARFAQQPEDPLVQIFAQLRDAELQLPILPVTLLCCLLCWRGWMLCKAGSPRRKVLCSLCMLLLWILLVLLTLWFTQVNGIQCGRVVQVLIPMLSAGLL